MTSKEKRDAIKGITMQELIDRGEVDQFAHLEELSDKQDSETKKFSDWVRDGEKQD